jgi:hypothetical protein
VFWRRAEYASRCSTDGRQRQRFFHIRIREMPSTWELELELKGRNGQSLDQRRRMVDNVINRSLTITSACHCTCLRTSSSGLSPGSPIIPLGPRTSKNAKKNPKKERLKEDRRDSQVLDRYIIQTPPKHSFCAYFYPKCKDNTRGTGQICTVRERK